MGRYQQRGSTKWIRKR